MIKAHLGVASRAYAASITNISIHDDSSGTASTFEQGFYALLRESVPIHLLRFLLEVDQVESGELDALITLRRADACKCWLLPGMDAPSITEGLDCGYSPARASLMDGAILHR